MGINLQLLRERAGIRQNQAADHIGVSQAQMSRYEADPGKVPFDVVQELCGLYGVDVGSAASTDRDDDPLAVSAPYEDADRKLSLLVDYTREFVTGSETDVQLDAEAYTLDDLERDVVRLRRRPIVALAGRFDAGKSRVANSLLGGRRLPENFTPTTATLTVVRHVDDRPDGMLEDVVLLRESFWHTEGYDGLHLDASHLDNQARIESHQLVKGTYDVLHKHGTHHVDGEENPPVEAHTALVYVDAPLLRACILLDLPGFGNGKDEVSEDVKKANAAVQLADVVVYCSGARGFLDSVDVLHIGNLLRVLPQPEVEDPSFPTLGNLVVLATHANPSAIKDDQLGTIRKLGAKRLHRHLNETVLRERGEAVGLPIEPEDVESRIFPFWAENEARSRGFETELRHLLCDALPRVREQEISAEVQALKEAAKGDYRTMISRFETRLEELDQTKQELDKQEEEADKRKETFRNARDEVAEAVRQGHGRTARAFDNAYDELMSVDALERLIRTTFSAADEAKAYAPAHVSELLQSRMEHAIKPEARAVEDVVEQYLSDVGAASFGERFRSGGVDVPFDARGAFIGGLAGLATWGGLAIWASGLGNLGGYIIAAKVVSLLSSVGISVGGTAAAASFIAAIGGPITLALGLAAVFGLGAWRLFGESWQRRLAKKIEKQFREQGVRDRLQAGIDQFWAETVHAFNVGADAFEARYQSYIGELRQIVADQSSARTRIQRQLERARALRDIFGGLPWAPLPSESGESKVEEAETEEAALL